MIWNLFGSNTIYTTYLQQFVLYGHVDNMYI